MQRIKWGGTLWQKEAGVSRGVITVPSVLRDLWLETLGAAHTRDMGDLRRDMGLRQRLYLQARPLRRTS